MSPEHRPIPTPMHRAIPRRRVPQLSILIQIRRGYLERRVRKAEDLLAHVAKAVSDVVRVLLGAGSERNAEDVETVHLVRHRDRECAVRGAEVGETVVRGEDCRPLVVGVDREILHVSLEGEPDRGKVERQLSGEVVVALVGWGRMSV